jgi:hypothetical protein
MPSRQLCMCCALTIWVRHSAPKAVTPGCARQKDFIGATSTATAFLLSTLVERRVEHSPARGYVGVHSLLRKALSANVLSWDRRFAPWPIFGTN